MNNPKISFVVPCYRLSHVLAECVESILSQTYTDLEVLIMDDNSPDNTGRVARSFKDCRVKYIHNPENLGHLRNYNKGITLSRGKYVWLISADDYLRQPYILEKYVELMEKYPRVGYTFCPGISVVDGQETNILEYSLYDKQDCIVSGGHFMGKLLNHNFVVAASVLVRRECYEKISLFPFNDGMEWSGDWYLWCIFALKFDVAYFAEPMVCYRAHNLSMTTTLARQENLHKCSGGDLAVPLMIRQKAKELGLYKVVEDCLHAVTNEYIRQCKSKKYQTSTWSLSIPQFEESLCRNVENEKERNWIRARVFDGVGDSLWLDGDYLPAKKFYLDSVRKDPRMLKVYAKLLLISLGIPGSYVRRVGRYLRGEELASCE
jgi:glycosyltransferase involved in cell wall biosynthesis